MGAPDRLTPSTGGAAIARSTSGAVARDAPERARRKVLTGLTSDPSGPLARFPAE
ncbi:MULTISPECIES: hypothetical protein [Streptomyces]|uniref:Uncharacterized protein n=1 Tax=Streptomyces sp. NBC_00093 TaxID=2975649 RepID=A0AAU2ACT0_9ACTN